MLILDDLIQKLSKLPGLGPRSARRMVLHLLKKRDHLMQPLIDSMTQAFSGVKVCTTCHNFDSHDPCHICNDPKRSESQVCVVADVSDLWAFERAHIFRGKYHVLGGLLSAVDGMGPEKLSLPSLIKRLENSPIQEVVFALNATIDGQTTMHYVMSQLKHLPLTFSNLAHGVPLGGELDYLDEGTLSLAFQARKAV